MKKIEKNLGLTMITVQMCAFNGMDKVLPILLEEEKVILTLVDPDELVYPEGYYFSSEYGGVTNRGNTINGDFECYPLYWMKRVVE